MRSTVRPCCWSVSAPSDFHAITYWGFNAGTTKLPAFELGTHGGGFTDVAKAWHGCISMRQDLPHKIQAGSDTEIEWMLT